MFTLLQFVYPLTGFEKKGGIILISRLNQQVMGVLAECGDHVSFE